MVGGLPVHHHLDIVVLGGIPDFLIAQPHQVGHGGFRRAGKGVVIIQEGKDKDGGCHNKGQGNPPQYRQRVGLDANPFNGLIGHRAPFHFLFLPLLSFGPLPEAAVLTGFQAGFPALYRLVPKAIHPFGGQ